MAIAFAIGKRLPVKWGIKMAWQRCSSRARAAGARRSAALEDYIHEDEAEQEAAIHGKGAAPQTRVPMREAAE